MTNKSVNIDFKKMIDDVKNYFTHLPKDMIIAWSVLGAGILFIIIALFII
jgi:hypothetical protein